MRTDRRTNITKLIVTFRNFAKMSKKETAFSYTTRTHNFSFLLVYFSQEEHEENA